MIRPTPRAVLLFGASVPIALVMVTAFPGFWYVSLYLPLAVLFLMLADFSLTLPPRRLAVAWKAPSRIPVGRESAVLFALESPERYRNLDLGCLMEADGPLCPQLLHQLPLREGRFEGSLPLLAERRGQGRLDAVWLRWTSPFGLLQYRIRHAMGHSLDIVPDIKGIHEAALQFFAHDAVYGIKTQRLRGEGTEFDNLTEFAPGMDNRFIDWKQSARHRKLLSKEFRQERNHQIVFGFDTGHLMLEPVEGMPKLDHAIRAGLLLSWISLHSGDLVGGLAFDQCPRNWCEPGRGMPHYSQFQRFTAALDYHTEETNFTLGLTMLNSRLKRRALIILFTEFVDSIAAELLLESLQLLTRRHLVVFVTLRDPLLGKLRDQRPESFLSSAESVIADDFLRDRAVVLERITRMGVHSLDVAASGVSSALLNRYLFIKQRGLL